MVVDVETLAVLLYLCAVVAVVIGGCEYLMFYNAWRSQRVQLLAGRFGRDHWLFREYSLARDAQLAIFSVGLSKECRRHRWRVLWALVVFFAFLGLGAMAQFSVYGPDPGGLQQRAYFLPLSSGLIR